MTKFFLYLTLAAFALACGGAEDQDAQGVDQDGDEIDLGTIEEPLSVHSSKYGISTASSHLTCRSDGPAGQACLVPVSKTIQYCYSDAGGAWTGSEVTSLDSVGGLIAGDFPSFGFAKVLISQTSCKNAGLINKIQKGTCSGGSTSGTIEAFVCYVPSQGTLLTESLPGTWRQMTGGTITVDLADLTAVGDDTFKSLRNFGITHSLAAAAGFGNDSTVSDITIHTSRSSIPRVVGAVGGSTSQEQCFALSVNTGGGGGGGFMSFDAAICPV